MERGSSIGQPATLEYELQHALGDRIELRGKLGEGGMAIVYEAYDRARGRTCALKLLRRELAHSFALVRFKREYRTAVALRHPCCIRAFEHGPAVGSWYYTMELARGGSLRRWLPLGDRQSQGGSRRPLPPADVLRIALRVLAGLDHIHSRGIVHRDIKPENILVGEHAAGELKIADFGIAQVGDLQEERFAGAVIGSRLYVAPEAVQGGAIDSRADLYALGLILYELLTGEHPLRAALGSSGEWLHVEGELQPRPLLEVARHVPDALARVVMRLLANAPAARFRTAAAAFDALAGLTGAHEVVSVLPPLADRPYLAAPPLVGRDAALAQGRAFVGAALAGAPAHAPVLLAISGVAGCGKSRLLGRLLKDVAANGARVLGGECRDRPDAPLAELSRILDALAARPGAALAAPATAGTDATADASAVDADADELSVQRELLSRSCASLLELAAREPVVIAAEDVQWMGSASLQLFAAWVRAASRARRQGRAVRIAFIVTQRPDPPGELLGPAVELGALARLEIEPFAFAQTAELVAALLGQHEDAAVRGFCRAVFAGGECTPLFVKQLLQLLVARGALHDVGARWNGAFRLEPERLAHIELPSTLQQAIGDRAARLSLETQRALAMAAVAGRRFALAELAHALGQHEGLLLECLEEAERAGLICQNASHEGEYVFVHDRYREAIHAHLPELERSEQHRAWAEAVLALRADSPELLPELAHHFAQAHDHARAHVYAFRAGDAALSANAFRQAVDMYRAARESAAAAGLAVEGRLLEHHGDACLNAGLYEEGAACYGDRLRDCSEHERTSLLVKLADLKFRGAKEKALDPQDALAALQNVMQQLGLKAPRSAPAVAVGALANMLPVVLYALLPGLVRTRPRRDAQQMEALCRALGLAAEVAFHFEPRLTHYYTLKAGTIGARLGPSPAAAQALAVVSLGAAQRGMHEIGRRLAALVEDVASNATSTPERGYIHLMLGLGAYTRGELQNAERQLEAGCALVERSAEPLRQGQLAAVLCLLYCQQGKGERAEALARRVLERAELGGMSYLAFSGCSALGLARHYAGSFAEAADWMARALAIPEARADVYSQLASLLQRDSALVCSELAARDDVRRLQQNVDLWQRHGFESVTVSFVSIAAAACIEWVVARGAIDRVFVGWLRAVCARERTQARRRKQQRPLYLGLRAALSALDGEPRRAAAGFGRASALARSLGVFGDVALIARLEAALEPACLRVKATA